MQESHHSIPQPAVSETLLVPNARTLKITTQTASKPIRIAQKTVACRFFVTWLPVCTLLKSWRPAWPPPALWRSSSDLPHLWHPSQSSTSRNRWWIPDGRRQHDLVHWMNMWLSTGSDCQAVWYLKSQQVVHGADDDVHCCCVPSLSPQEVLKV